jgi:hypothetical protein
MHQGYGARGFDRNSRSRMPLVPTPSRLKRCHSCDPNDIPLGLSLLLPVGTVNYVQPLKVRGRWKDGLGTAAAWGSYRARFSFLTPSNQVHGARFSSLTPSNQLHGAVPCTVILPH